MPHEERAHAFLAQARLRNEAPALAPVLAARGVGPYRGYNEVLGEIEHLVAQGYRAHPIGRSVEGEPIIALHLGQEPRGTLARATVILSGVHPMEWIGVETNLRVLQRLAETDLRDRAVIAIPLVNPDGFRRVDKSLRAGRRRFIRHNARGVDLNRNFDSRWGRLGLVQRLLGNLFHPGSAPASEPEVESIAHHLSVCRVDRALSLHSFGGAVLYPLASSTRPVHDVMEHRAWATRMARACDPRKPYKAASCARWAKGITAGGLELDWFHERHGAVSFLIECSRGGRSLRPSRLFDPFAWFNPPRPDREADAIANAVTPFVRGDLP
ncbi:MAG: hypothetical protein HOW73_07010 [Polyangiaceae bacterium]|nr:hypothetical protein [Polyangiaceae bacterium]